MCDWVITSIFQNEGGLGKSMLHGSFVWLNIPLLRHLYHCHCVSLYISMWEQSEPIQVGSEALSWPLVVYMAHWSILSVLQRMGIPCRTFLGGCQALWRKVWGCQEFSEHSYCWPSVSIDRSQPQALPSSLSTQHYSLRGRMLTNRTVHNREPSTAEVFSFEISFNIIFLFFFWFSRQCFSV